MSRTTTRTRVSSGAAFALASLLAVAGPATAATTSPPATTGTARSAATAPATSTDPAELAGGYLARELTRAGGHFANTFNGTSYPDYGLTLDAVLALDAAGIGQDAARAATAYVATNVRSYVTGADYGAASERYAGALAKTLNVAVAQRLDPSDFGGVDLVAELAAREASSGRFEDAFDPNVSGGDYSNTFSQSFAVLGLERAGVGASAEAVAFLKLQQCPGGGFRLIEAATACADDSTADADSTSLAVQALIAAGSTRDAAVVRALNWLTARQGADGGFGGGVSTEAENANSTGLAGQALLAGGRTAPARKAVQYVRGLQYGCDFPPALRGGIAYNRESYDKQDAKNASAAPDDQDRRSTAQAALALAGTPLGLVTAADADQNAPTLACTAPTASPTASPTSTRPTTTRTTTTTTTTTRTTTATGSGTGTSTHTTNGGAGAGAPSTSTSQGVGPAAVVGNSGGLGRLPRTGSAVGPIALTGLALVLAGSGAVVLARRRTARGEHS